jgi:hypothetical protein
MVQVRDGVGRIEKKRRKFLVLNKFTTFIQIKIQ